MSTGHSENFANECLDAHNMYRALHGCPPLQLNQQLTDAANRWAQELLKTNIMEHSTGNKYGENIYMAQGLTVTGDMPVKAWYDEIDDYNFEESKFMPNTGHFTQVIWKNTKELGVGIAHKGNNTYVVTNYYPAGNFIGRFKDNVPELVGSAVRRKSNAEDEIDETADSATKLRMSIVKKEERFQTECLEAHNRFRALHGVKPLQLDDELTKFATKWAQGLADLDKLKHSATKEYGENIYMSDGIRISGASPVKVWYDEIFEYDFESAKFSPKSGGFTQIVWKDSKKLGVGIARKDRVTVVVAIYSPPGNVKGLFKENVPPIGGFKHSGSQDAAPSSPGKKPESLKKGKDDAVADPRKKRDGSKDDADDRSSSISIQRKSLKDETDDEYDAPDMSRKLKEKLKDVKDNDLSGDEDDDEDDSPSPPSKNREKVRDRHSDAPTSRSKKKGSSKEDQLSASASSNMTIESLKEKDSASSVPTKKKPGSKELKDTSSTRLSKTRSETSKEKMEASPAGPSKKKGETSKGSREASPSARSRKKRKTSKESREASPSASKKKKGKTSKGSREASPTVSKKKKGQTSKESREASPAGPSKKRGDSPAAVSKKKGETSKDSTDASSAGREASPAGPSKKRGDSPAAVSKKKGGTSKDSTDASSAGREASPAGPSKKRGDSPAAVSKKKGGTSKDSTDASSAGPSKKGDISKSGPKEKTSQGDSDQKRSSVNKAVQAFFSWTYEESPKGPLKKDAEKPNAKEAPKPPAKGGAKPTAKSGEKPTVARSSSDKPTTSRKPSTAKDTSAKKPKPPCPHRTHESGVGFVPILFATVAMISMVFFAAYLKYTH